MSSLSGGARKSIEVGQTLKHKKNYAKTSVV
jgi:hypothetical protein